MRTEVEGGCSCEPAAVDLLLETQSTRLTCSRRIFLQQLLELSWTRVGVYITVMSNREGELESEIRLLYFKKKRYWDHTCSCRMFPCNLGSLSTSASKLASICICKSFISYKLLALKVTEDVCLRGRSRCFCSHVGRRSNRRWSRLIIKCKGFSVQPMERLYYYQYWSAVFNHHILGYTGACQIVFLVQRPWNQQILQTKQPRVVSTHRCDA